MDNPIPYVEEYCTCEDYYQPVVDEDKNNIRLFNICCTRAFNKKIAFCKLKWYIINNKCVVLRRGRTSLFNTIF